MSPPQLRPFVNAVIARLQAGTGMEVGNHSAPADDDPPYLFVSLVAGGDADGPTAAPSDHGYLTVQVSSVGAGAEAALWGADKARDALVGWRPSVAGRSVMPLELTSAATEAFPDFDLTPPRFTAADRFGCWSYPA